LTDHYSQLSEMAAKHGFAAHDGFLVTEMRRVISAANAEIGWQPMSGASTNQRSEELPLVSFPCPAAVENVPVLAVPVTLADAGSHERPALFYIDDISPNHPLYQRPLRAWGLLDDWRWCLQLWTLGTATRLVPKLRRALPILSPSAADLFGAGTEASPFQPGGTTGEARLMALFGLQRQPDTTLPILGRYLQRRIRKGVALGGFGTMLRNRAIAFQDEEMRALRWHYLRGQPITMLAIGPYDGRHHELAAIRGVFERLEAADGQRFRKLIRVGFAEPDRVGTQIARAIAHKHGIELFEVPGLDLAHPEQSGLRELVAAERSLWRARAPWAGEAHVRAVFVGSAGEYRWGNVERLLRACHDAGIDTIHGSFMKDTRFLRMAVMLSRKDWQIHESEKHIARTLRSAGYQVDRLFSQKRNPVVNVSARRVAPEAAPRH
jgi:hypothetical protein